LGVYERTSQHDTYIRIFRYEETNDKREPAKEESQQEREPKKKKIVEKSTRDK